MDNKNLSPIVLMADDCEGTRKIFSTFLKKAGFRFTLFSDGLTAFESACNTHYDIVIADHDMPGMTGLELLKKLRQHKPALPVIIISATCTVVDAVEILRCGAIDIVKKPVEFDRLQGVIDRIIKGIQDSEVENNLYSYVTDSSMNLEFMVKDLVNKPFTLPIVNRLLTCGKIDLKTKLQLTLVFQEALTNAIEHGNLGLESDWKKDVFEDGLDKYTIIKRERLAMSNYSNSLIKISVHFDRENLVFTIKDAGKGFVVKDINKHDDSKLELNCFGRGMSILEECVDKVEYSEGGTKVTLSKVLR